MVVENTEHFPLSKTKQIKGSRRLAREKVLQIVSANIISETPVELLFNHIFFRKFIFDDDFNKNHERLLTPDEIFELEADIPIKWKEEDIDYGDKLIKFIITNHDYLDSLLDQFTQNWDLTRMALVDRILMYIAIGEMLSICDIPTKVSVNEAIDLAKKYSTDKSSTFINGLLDSVLEKLNKEGAIKKTGRGLINT